MEPMQDPLNISTGRSADALIAVSLINGAVNKDGVNAGGENDKGVVYEQVTEEVVYDDILIYEGGIEEAIKAEPINPEDMIAEALNAGKVNAEEYFAEVRNAAARNGGTNEALITEFMSAKARHAELSNTESIPFNDNPAKFWNAKAMKYEALVSEEWNKITKDDEPMDAIDTNSEATENEAISNEGIDDETLSDADRKFEDMEAEAMVAEALDDKAGNADSILLKTLVDEAFSGASTHDKGTTDAGEANDEPISIDRDQFMNNEDLRQKWLAQHKHFFNSPDSKLNLLELWAESKDNLVEDLSQKTLEVQKLNSRLQDLLQELSEENLEIDEEDFLEFKKKLLEENPSIEYLEELLKQEYLEALQDQQPPTPERQDKMQPTNPKPVMSFLANEDGQVVIGPNGTTIAKTALEAINWSLSGPALTRKLLMEVFDRETLAFRTLTGKPSPAFLDCDKPMKGQLDPLKVADVTHFVMEHTDLTVKEVRNAITTKCADENKMHRQREKKRKIAALKLKPEP